MAFNNGFPMNYPQYYPQYQQPQAQIPQPTQAQSQPNPQNNTMTWVQGETGAKSYLLAPNTTIPLWDSEAQTIYLKSTDASGMPSMKILDYTIRESMQAHQKNTVIEQPQMQADFVTHEELKDFEAKMIRKIDELTKEELGA